MSVLIKGMNMPKDIAPNVHRTVTLIISGDGKIYDVNRNMLPAVAVEVPEPHGRLIDAVKTFENVELAYRHVAGDEFDDETLNHVLAAIVVTPTVIEAEGKK